MLHGYAGDASELLDLARGLPATCVIPTAAQSSPDGGRQWWPLDPDRRPAWAWSADPPRGYQPRPEVAAARAAVIGLLDEVRSRIQPTSVALVGYSQRAMLALDVSLRTPVVDRVVAISGALLADSVAVLWSAPRRSFLIAHGRHDEEIPIAAGEQARDLLIGFAHNVRWLPYDGGHEIPASLAAEFAGFLG